MKIYRFLRRKVRFAAKGKAVGIPGAHRLEFHEWRGDSPLPPYRGDVPTMIVIVINGGAAFTRDGRTVLAGPGDAILVEAGHGELKFLRANIGGVVLIQIITFDERSMAKQWRAFPGAEICAYILPDFPVTGICLKQFASKLRHPRSAESFLGIPPPREVLHSLFDGSWIRAFGLARSIFYKKRWRLLGLLEENVLKRVGETEMASTYPGGLRQFRRDCRVYAGCSPKQWMGRRKVELAKLWIRCGHDIGEIAQTLGFSDLWEFKCVMSAWTHRSWEELLRLPRLDTLTAKELVDLLRPWWWPAPLPLSNRLQRLADLCVEDDEPDVADFLDLEDPSRIEQRARAKEPGADKLLAQIDEAFFAMKSTAAGVVVPFFDLPGGAFEAGQPLANAA